MSETYITVELRRLVEKRADFHCEYCLLHRDDSIFGHHCDHIISEKHDGPTDESNLALCCLSCNSHKGSDIASISTDGKLVALLSAPPAMELAFPLR